MTAGTLESPEPSPIAALFAFAFLAFLFASIYAWSWALRNRQSLWTWSGWEKDQPSARIGLIDLIGCGACIVIAQIMTLGLVQSTVGIRKETQPAAAALISSADAESALQQAEEVKKVPTGLTPILTLSLLLGGILSMALVMFRTGGPPNSIGLPGSSWRLDIRVGLIAFLLTTPVILILSQVAIRLTKIEYDHPVIDSMREHPWAYPLLFVGAVIGAPLWEEFAFRALLIGWLDSIRVSRGDLRTIFLGRPRVATSSTSGEDSASVIVAQVANPRTGQETAIRTTDDVSPVMGNPYLPPSPLTGEVDGFNVTTIDRESQLRYPPWWPAVISGAVFGIAHMGYGVSWIPLIFFGIVLGRLFQLRRSFLPCVVLHACFNGLSMLGLAVQVFAGKG